MPLSARAVLTVRSSDPEHVIAAYNPLVLACFVRQVSLKEIETLRALVVEGLDEGIRGGLLYVVARKELTGGIDPRARVMFEQMVKQNSARSGESAVVILTQGFAGAMLRGVVTSLLQLTNRRKLLQVFASVEEACRWLAPLHGLDAAALKLAYDEATAHLAR